MLGSFQPQGLSPARLHCPWYFTGKNTGVGCHFLLQGNLPDPGIEPVSLVLQADSLPLSHLGSHCLHSVKCSPERESNSAQPPSPFLPAALLLVQCRVKTRYLVSNLAPPHHIAVLLFSHSVLSDPVTPWTAACQVSLSFIISQSLLKLMSMRL